MSFIKTVVLSLFGLVLTTLHGVRSKIHIVLPLVAWREANLVSFLKYFLELCHRYFCTSIMPTTSEKGGGALGTQPLMITVPVNIPRRYINIWPRLK